MPAPAHKWSPNNGIPFRNKLLGRNELLGKLGNIFPQLTNLAVHNPLSAAVAEKFFGVCRGAQLTPLEHTAEHLQNGSKNHKPAA